MDYKKLALAIVRKAKEEKADYHQLLNYWINIFEDSRVNGFSRTKLINEVENKG